MIKMAGEDGEVIEEPISDFNFDTWATELGLPRKVTQILRQEELTTKRALTLIETKDLKELGLPLGTIKVIMDELSKLKAPLPSGTATDDADTAPIITADKTNFLAGAGKTLDLLLSEAKDAPHTEVFGHMDPRTILTLKYKSAKAVHITEFLTEQSKRRRTAKRREFIIKTGAKDAESLVFKAEDDHPYLGIYIEEWGAANMRLLNHLLTTNQLQRKDTEFYLAYTTKIYEFAEKYEWNSVLSYDYTYREIQAEHNFKWGTFSPHMELQLLVPKRARQSSAGGRTNTTGSTEDCRIFKAKGSCPFKEACRYRHPEAKVKSETSDKPKNM